MDTQGTWTRRKTVVVTAILAGGILWAALGQEPDRNDGRFACDRFATMAADVSDGVLTDDEIRQAAQTVADRAVGTDVDDEGRRLLAAATTGTVDEFIDAMGDMQSAC